MLNKTRKLVTLAVPLATLLALPLSGNGATLNGKINGHNCAHAGASCPVDRLDPHIALESDFVLVVSNGDYYFMPNLSRDIKVRHVLENVQVTGDVDDKYHTIKVTELKGKTGNTLWSQKQSDFEMRALYGDGVAWPGQKQ